MGNELNLKISPEIYPLEKEKANKQTIWEHYFARKIAFLLAPFFLKLGISANQTSFLSIASGVTASILIAFGNFWLVLSGTVLMQIWLILDKTDGLIARLKKAPTKFGEFFEELNGSLIAVLFFASIGVAASRFPGFSLFLISPKIFVVLGTITSLFVIFRHLTARHFEAVFGEDKKLGGSSLLYGILVKFSGVYSLAQPILILAVIFNFLGIYTLAYFFIQGALMLANVVYLTAKASKR